MNSRRRISKGNSQDESERELEIQKTMELNQKLESVN